MRKGYMFILRTPKFVLSVVLGIVHFRRKRVEGIDLDFGCLHTRNARAYLDGMLRTPAYEVTWDVPKAISKHQHSEV